MSNNICNNNAVDGAPAPRRGTISTADLLRDCFSEEQLELISTRGIDKTEDSWDDEGFSALLIDPYHLKEADEGGITEHYFHSAGQLEQSGFSVYMEDAYSEEKLLEIVEQQEQQEQDLHEESYLEYINGEFADEFLKYAEAQAEQQEQDLHGESYLEYIKEEVADETLKHAEAQAEQSMIVPVYRRKAKEEAVHNIIQGKVEGSIKEKTAYAHALKIIEDNDMIFFDSPELDNSSVSCYNGRYWERLTDTKLESMIYSHLSGAERNSYDGIAQRVKNIKQFIFLECQERYYREDGRFKPKQWKKAENRIVFKNCVYDVLTQQTMPFDKKYPYYFGLNIEYVEATEETPTYDKFRRQATNGDGEAMDLFDLMLIYLCIPNRSGKCMFYLTYARDSGKSIFVELMEELFPPGLTSRFSPEHLGGRFSLSQVENSILITCPEMNIERIEPKACVEIKRLTGESKLRIEKKYVNQKTVINRAKIVIASNQGFDMGKYYDPALMRRIIAVPFLTSTRLEDIDYALKDKLKHEMPFIISNAARKFSRVIDLDGGIKIPECSLSQQLKQTWNAQPDCVSDFIETYLEATNNAESFIWKQDLYDQYKIFFSQNAIYTNSVCCDLNMLIDKVKAAFPCRSNKRRIASRAKNPKPAISGIRWKNPEDVPEEFSIGCSNE